MAAVQKISVTEAEKRFNAFGLPDYRLRNVTDLKVVFGHDVKLLKGYSDLTAEQQQLFDAFICNYYNCVGMGLKCGFVPKSIHYVEKITYCVSRPADEWNETPYKEVCAAVFNILLPDGKKRRFKFHNFWIGCRLSSRKNGIRKCLISDSTTWTAWRVCANSRINISIWQSLTHHTE